MKEQLTTQEVKILDEWLDFDQANDCLDRFCLILNYHFEGDECLVELPDKW